MDPQTTSTTDGAATALLDAPASTPAATDQSAAAEQGAQGDVTTTTEARGTGEQARTETGASQTAKQQEDWRVWKGRHDGLQGHLQSVQQQAAEAQRRFEESQQQIRQLQIAQQETNLRMQGVPAEQIGRWKAQQTELANRQAALEREKQTVLQERQRTQEMLQQAEPAFRKLAADQIAAEFGGVVPADKLLRFNSPQEMRAHAEALHEAARGQRLAERREKKVDVAESSGTGGVDLSKLSAHELMRRGIAEEKRKLGIR